MEEWEFKSLIEKFYSSLTEGSKREYLMLFSDLQIQIEGWFRGELMNYLKNEKIKMTVYNREVPINDNNRRKVDLRIEVNNEFYWIELKHILVGCQKNDIYKLEFYFSNNAYIHNDIKKLQEIDKSNERQHGYSLAFISTNYSCDKCKNPKFEEINSKEILEKQYKEVKKNKTDIEQDVTDVSCNYDSITHFGYLLLEVKMKNGNVK